ncbi:MAG: hypothetical protein V1863_05470 [Candidatus Omnitrophota bacterium]
MSLIAKIKMMMPIRLRKRALAWVGENRKKPFFLWVHYLDTHFPYHAPEGFGTLFLKEQFLFLKGKLEEFLQRATPAQTMHSENAALSDDVKDKLKSLGYIQ